MFYHCVFGIGSYLNPQSMEFFHQLISILLSKQLYGE